MGPPEHLVTISNSRWIETSQQLAETSPASRSQPGYYDNANCKLTSAWLDSPYERDFRSPSSIAADKMSLLSFMRTINSNSKEKILVFESEKSGGAPYCRLLLAQHVRNIKRNPSSSYRAR